MVITTKTIKCAIDLAGTEAGNGTFHVNINHLVSKIAITHGAVVQVVVPAENLLLVQSSLVDGETLGILPSHAAQYILPPRLGITYYFENPKSVRGVHTMSARHVSSEAVPTGGVYVFIIEFHGPDC